MSRLVFLVIIDAGIQAVVRRPQSRQELPERSPLTFPGGFWGRDKR